MIILRDISLRRGSQLLFEGAEARLLPGQKSALTGANGCGKSSLFALLRGELTADHGEIEGLAGQRIAHMDQDVPASDTPAQRFVLQGDGEVADLLEELEQHEASGDFEAAARCHQALEACRGYDAPRRAALLLDGLGFAPGDGERPVADFSGGWRVRLGLARALMMPSDLLLLDEPTNHLDLDTTLWLQQFLSAYEGTLLLISHDRDFIDRCCTAVLHIEHQQLRSYRGGYSDFEQQRAQRLAQEQAAAARHAKRRAEIEDFVRRFRAKATKARQAQSRLKELERMGEMTIAHADTPFDFRFPEPPRGKDPLLELREASVGYDADAALARGVNLPLRNGDRIALLGRNGSGKTTLLRTLCGELPLLAGERQHSEGCRIAYFDQQQIDTLDLQASALLHLQRLTPDAREQEIRDFLGGFDFRGDRADAPLAPFSGGEKARLALAMLAWQRPNVLILDEPTNHLDLEMRRALELALLDFAGAVVIVSHDRHLLRSSAEQLFQLHGGALHRFDDSLEAYEAQILRDDSTPRDAPAAAESSSREDRREQRRAAAAARDRRRPLEKAIQRIESQMEKTQGQLDDIEEQLGDATLYDEARKDELTKLLREQGDLRQTLEELEQDWLSQQEALEALTPPD